MFVISTNTRQWIKAALVCSLLGTAQFALATGGMGGGTGLESGFQKILNIVSTVVVSIATIALIVECVLGLLKVVRWHDLMAFIVWTIIIGAAAGIVKGAIALGKSSTFF